MTKPSRESRAIEAVLRATFQVDDGGRRHCLICHAMQHDYPSGHAPGCRVDAALRFVLGETDEMPSVATYAEPAPSH